MKKYKDYLLPMGFVLIAQAFVYFLIKNIIVDYHVINSFLDTPVIKGFVFFYDSWYPFIIIITFLVYLHDKELFKYMVITLMVTAFLSHITFIIYPTEVSRPVIEVKNFLDWVLDFTYKSDSPAVNCLPSLHCIYSFVVSYFIVRCKNADYKLKIFTCFYSLMIVLSTLFIKQHIIEDVIFSVIYTVVVLVIVYFNKNNILKLFNKLHL